MGNGIKTVFFLVLFFALGIMGRPALAHEDMQETKTGTIAGQVMLKGDGPLAGGMVYFFNEKAGPSPSATKYWRVPGEAFGTDGNGRFVAELPAGVTCLGKCHPTGIIIACQGTAAQARLMGYVNRR